MLHLAHVVRHVGVEFGELDHGLLDPGHPQGPTHYYQTRFWTRVTLRPFERAFETVARRLVEPEHVLQELAWGRVSIARVLLELALAAEVAAADTGF